MVTRRQMWVSAVTALAVSVATGTVYAAPVGQLDIPVEQLYAVGGVLLVALAVALSIIAAVIIVVRFAQSRTPAPEPGIQGKLVDLLSDTSDAVRHVGDNIASLTQEHKLTREQANEAQRLSEEAWQRIRDYDAGHQRSMNDINQTQRQITEALSGVNDKIQTTAVMHEQSVTERHKATNDNIDATRLSLSMKMDEMAAQLSAVQRVVESLERTVGTDIQGEIATIRAIVTTLQTEMKTLHSEIKEATKHETPNPNPATLPTDGGLRASADTGTDVGIDAGDNPQ